MTLNRTRTSPRTIAAIGFLAAMGLFLTACNSDGSVDDVSANSSVSAKARSDSSPTSGKGAGLDSREDGTVTGTLTYMAPGKLKVDGRPFFVAEDTKIWGAGEICGEPSEQSTAACSVEELEAAAKTSTAVAEVVIKGGTAITITDQYEAGNPSEVDEGHVAGADGSGSAAEEPTEESDSGAGASADNREDGAVTGTLTYMAPGKLKVDGRPFFVAEDTEILGTGGICGETDQPAAACSVEELEAAAKTSTAVAEVEIKEGAAVKITDQAGNPSMVDEGHVAGADAF